MKCSKCKNTLRVEIENREDILGQGAEGEVIKGHSIDCGYSGKLLKIKTNEAPPKVIGKLTSGELIYE